MEVLRTNKDISDLLDVQLSMARQIDIIWANQKQEKLGGNSNNTTANSKPGD